MAEISSESQFFSGNIANMIPEGPLNKMVPLTRKSITGSNASFSPDLNVTLGGKHPAMI